jgi:hypothetical protein
LRELQKQEYGWEVVVAGFPWLRFARDVVCILIENMFGQREDLYRLRKGGTGAVSI